MNISDPIPISSSNGSIEGSTSASAGTGTGYATSPGVLGDAGRQKSNQNITSPSVSASRLDAQGSYATTSAGQYGSISSPLHVGSPGAGVGGGSREGAGYIDSPSNIGIAGLALDTNPIQGTSSAQSQQAIVPVGFEEGTLRALCDLDCGFPLLMDRIKQSMASCRETSVFFKKRAQIEEDYARSLQKLTRERLESYSLSDGKGGSFVSAYNALLRSHDLLADNHVKMAQQLSEMSEQLIETAREVERSRKTAKELGNRLERNLTDSESQTDKSRGRFDTSVEDLERILISKAGENARDMSNMPSEHLSNSSSKRTLGKAIGKLKGGPKNPAQLQRMEEDARYKMNSLSDTYRQSVISTQTIRQEYFNLQLPRMLKSLKESLDEIDLGTQFHLSRYAYLFENLLVNDGLTVSPATGLGGATDDAPGLKAIAESIDNREDFKKFMQNYAVSFASSGQRVLRREGPPEEGFVRMPRVPGQLNGGTGANSQNPQSHQIPASQSGTLPNATSYGNMASQQHSQPSLQQQQHQLQAVYFGVDLSYQMERDGADIPKVVQKCAEAVEAHGLQTQGIYRLSGTTSRIQRLKARMEKDVDSVNLNSDENLSDINDISGLLKLFFRELPDPLFTHELYYGFIEAAKIENARLRHIRLHEKINELPDPNYATCKYLLGHLDKIRENSVVNSMTISNLAIVFGPTLLRAPDDNPNSIADMKYQYKAIETILEHYAEIFIEAEEDPETQEPTQPLPSPGLAYPSEAQRHAGAGSLPKSPTTGSMSDNMI